MTITEHLFYAFRHIYHDPIQHVYFDLIERRKIESTTRRIAAEVKQPFRELYWLCWDVIKQNFDKANIKSDMSRGIRHNHFLIMGEQIRYKDFAAKQETEINKVRKQWKAKSEQGRMRGTICHRFMENLAIRNLMHLSAIPEEYHAHVKHMKDYWFSYNKDCIPIAPEVTIGSYKLGIAGKFDLLEQSVIDGKKWLTDYKFNEAVSIHNMFRNMNSPFSALADTDLNYFTVQLNTYRFIIEYCSNLKIDGMRVVHITPDGFEVIEIEDIQHMITLWLVKQ